MNEEMIKKAKEAQEKSLNDEELDGVNGGRFDALDHLEKSMYCSKCKIYTKHVFDTKTRRRQCSVCGTLCSGY